MRVLAGYAFLLSYAVYIATGGGILARNVLIVSVVPLFFRALWHRRDFPAKYAIFSVLVFSAALMLQPIDAARMLESVGTFAAVIGLLAYLRAMGTPLETRRYRAAFRFASSQLEARGIRVQSVVIVLSVVLGQLLAYAIVPLLHQILGVGRADSKPIASWAVRGFSIAILCSVTFPTASVVLTQFGISPWQFLVRALPGAALMTIFMILVSRRDDQLELSIADDHSLGKIGEQALLVRVMIYFVVTITTVLVLGTLVQEVGYLILVAGTVGVAAVAFGMFDALTGESAGLIAVRRYLRAWPDISMPEVLIFGGSGMILYALHVFGFLDAVVDLFLLSLNAQGVWVAAPYHLAFFVICVLFWLGVHPIVSAVIVSQAISMAVLGVEVSLPTFAVAITAGTVVGMLASPFSALSNLWAALTNQSVMRVIRLNAGIALAVLAMMNAYFALLAVFGW